MKDLPIIISGSGTEQRFSVPKLPSGTGQAMADVMIEVLSEWGVKNCIKLLSFDITSSNTGRKNGAPERSALPGLQISYP